MAAIATTTALETTVTHAFNVMVDGQKIAFGDCTYEGLKRTDPRAALELAAGEAAICALNLLEQAGAGSYHLGSPRVRGLITDRAGAGVYALILETVAAAS